MSPGADTVVHAHVSGLPAVELPVGKYTTLPPAGVPEGTPLIASGLPVPGSNGMMS